MVLFRTYYLGLAPYDTARHFVGLRERSCLNWTEEIRQRCGEELADWIYRSNVSPTRRGLPASVEAMRVLVARQ